MATGVLPVFVGRATRAVEFAAESGEGIPGRPAPGPDHRHPGHHRHRDWPPTPSRQAGPTWRPSCPSSPGTSFRSPPCTRPSSARGRSSMSWPAGARRWSGTPGPSPSTPWRSWTSPSPTEYTLRVACSKGTYVRTLCHDIGQALGCGGTHVRPAPDPGRGLHPGPGSHPGGRRRLRQTRAGAAAAGGRLLCPPSRPDPSPVPGPRARSATATPSPCLGRTESTGSTVRRVPSWP